MKVKSLISQAEIDFFSKKRTTFLSTKTVKNMRITSFIVKANNLTKSDS